MKYIVKAKIEVEGSVDKPDIIGAIFGQTEGLFGSEFDLRELQEKGRIGRIYVEIKNVGNKTVGEVIIPSNLDKNETALLAAMIETVDRVGPYSAKIHVTELIDLRLEKIRRIVERAKEFMSRWSREKTPDLKEILNEISSVTKIASITTYGPEKLPAGPEVATSDTIIVVEGRADVINLLRAGYKNAIAIEGAQGKVPESLIKLAQKKTVIAFVDGDRAGDMILKTLIESMKVDYVAKAPPGREVEELSIKEIEKALKNMIPLSEYLKQLEKKREVKPVEAAPPAQPRIQQEERLLEQAINIQTQAVSPSETIKVETQPIESVSQMVSEKIETEKISGETEVKETERPAEISAEVERSIERIQIPSTVVEDIKSLTGTLTCIIYDQGWNVLSKISVRDLYEFLEKNSGDTNIYAIVLDGIVTQRLVESARRRGVKILIGYRIGSQVSTTNEEIMIYTFDEVLKKFSSQ